LIEFYNGDLIMHAKYVHRDFEAHNQKRFTYHLLIKPSCNSSEPWPKYGI